MLERKPRTSTRNVDRQKAKWAADMRKVAGKVGKGMRMTKGRNLADLRVCLLI